MNENKKKRLTIDLPYRTHRAFKLKCVKTATDMKVVVANAIDEFLKGKSEEKTK